MKEILKHVIEFSIFGGMLGLLTLFLRPFVSFYRSLRELLSSIVVSIIVGLLLEYTSLDISVKYGIVGAFSCFAPQIFEGFSKIAHSFSKNPYSFIKNVVKSKTGVDINNEHRDN